MRSIELWPSINIVVMFSRDDMDMEMWNRLTRTLVTCIQEVHSVISTMLNTVIGNLFNRCHQVI